MKCALLCLGIVKLPAAHITCVSGDVFRGISGSATLQEQLLAAIGGGLEVETWSVLPQGYVAMRTPPPTPTTPRSCCCDLPVVHLRLRRRRRRRRR